jgi:cytoskeletal protein CcmA (bactofilin family)
LLEKLAAARRHQSAAPVTTPAASPSAALPELRIDGRTEGSIQYSGTVTVGPNGAVIGDICATVICVEGAITGNVYAEDALRVAASATIIGDLQASRVAVARGAQLRGNIAMRRGLRPAPDLDDQGVEALLTRSR